MADLIDLLQPILVQAPGCPEPLAEFHYRRAAREFFTETRAYTREVTLSVGATLNEYTLALPEATEAFDGRYALYNGVRLKKAAADQSARAYAQDTTGTPRLYRVSGDSLLVAPSPLEDVSAKLTLSAVLRPTRTAAVLDDALLDDFVDVLEQGTLARLMLMPGKGWSDERAGRIYFQQFTDAKDTWRSRAADDGMRGVPRRVKYGGY